MAKSRRSKTRKTASSTSRTSKKRGGAKKKTSRAGAARSVGKKDVLDLKKVRRDLERAVISMGRRSVREGQDPLIVDSTRERMTRWMSEIDEFCTEERQERCGPTMIFPLEE